MSSKNMGVRIRYGLPIEITCPFCHLTGNRARFVCCSHYTCGCGAKGFQVRPDRLCIVFYEPREMILEADNA